MVRDLDLAELRRAVVREIDNYVYEVPKDAYGKAWSPDKVNRELRAFREALVAPYWTIVVDEARQEKPCAVVADDGKSSLLVFEPQSRMFMLVLRKGDALISFGLDGDAVGCFLAR